MKHNGKLLGTPVVLAVVLAAGRASAASATADRLEDISRQLAEVGKGLAAVQRSLGDVEDLRRQQGQMRQELDNLRKNGAEGRLEGVASQIEGLRNDLARSQAATRKELEAFREEGQAAGEAFRHTHGEMEELRNQQARLRQDLEACRKGGSGDSLEGLAAQLADLKKGVDDLRLTVRRDLEQVREDGKATGAAFQKSREEMDELRQQAVRLRQEVEALRDRGREPGRFSLYPPPGPGDEASAASAAELNRRLDRLHQELVGQTGREIEGLRGQVDRLQEEVAGLRRRALPPPEVSLYPPPDQPAGRETEEIKAQLRRLDQDLRGVKDRLPPRVSYYAGPGPEFGRIRLMNTYPREMVFVVNGRTYQLAPGQTLDLDEQPAGSFTYQVPGVQPETQTRWLSPNDTFTIVAHAR